MKQSTSETAHFYKKNNLYSILTQLAGVVEYTDCTSAEK